MTKTSPEFVSFLQMSYERPSVDALTEEINACTRNLAAAKSADEAIGIFIAEDELCAHIRTLAEIASVRHAINTADETWDAEARFWDSASPELEAAYDAYNAELLASSWRPELEQRFGSLHFAKLSQRRRCFSPEIVEDLKGENDLAQQYLKLVASAQIPFEGRLLTLPQLAAFKVDTDDTRRLAAWMAEGSWFKEQQPELDRIFDELVRVRDRMGRALGYENYIPLGFDRMERLGYGPCDLKRFREAVVDYVVPLADNIRRNQAARLGYSYPLSYSDEALRFRSGNPRPKGDKDDLLVAGLAFYQSLSETCGEFFSTMLNCDLMDVVSREGKAQGGFMCSFPDYHVPFIFANFNGTSGDVDVVTHEAGHALSYYLNRDRVPSTLSMPSMEACEVHSMSMEFLAWKSCEEFFGEDARKYRYMHLSNALTFIPYGTMVDHFQELVYERPAMTPARRHATWKELIGIYMPWISLDEIIPVYGEGHGWQRQLHIYEYPFYYIDYCLAQTVSLEFWALMQESFADAWERYMAYSLQGGTRSFTELLAHADLVSPFEDGCLKAICEKAGAWLDAYDLSGIV